MTRARMPYIPHTLALVGNIYSKDDCYFKGP